MVPVRSENRVRFASADALFDRSSLTARSRGRGEVSFTGSYEEKLEMPSSSQGPMVAH
jgi:hypothetical protein